MNVFISQPMSGKNIEDIMRYRRRAIYTINNVIFCDGKDEQDRPICILDNLQEDKDPETTSSLEYLGEDIKMLDKADIIYFVKDWEKSRGCNIEFQVAKEYGIPMIFE